MSHMIETMAYTGQVPWHGLGVSKPEGWRNVKGLLKDASLDWTVSKHQLFLGDGREMTGEFALVRDSDSTILDAVGSKYIPVQNADAFAFFQKFVDAGGMTLETAGSLCDGRYTWGLARVGKDFSIGRGKVKDKIESFLLLSSPHVHFKSMEIRFTPIRVVCWNTLSYALRRANRNGNGQAFRLPHQTEFTDNVKAKAELALGLAVKQADEFKEAAQLLASTKAREPEVREYFLEVLQWDEEKARVKAELAERDVREPRVLPKFMAALDGAPGADYATARGTWWGALNAVTYVVDHELGDDRGMAMRSAWFGPRAELKTRALELAIAKAA